MVRLIIAVLLWGVAHSSTAQSFSEYRVPIRFHGKPARPQMNTVQSRRFRTQIREAVAVGPNFADHYTVAIWGCGSSCAMFSIINDLDGSVYDFPYSVVWTWEADYGVNFRRHSRAIHVVGQLNEDGNSADRWYVWNGKELILKSEHPACHTDVQDCDGKKAWRKPLDR